jgi:hypothetical protein
MEDELQITLTNDYILSIVHPCTMERTSFGTTETSLLLETTAIHGGSETLLRKKLNCSAFFRTKHLNQGGFLGWNPKSPFFFWGL